MKLLFSDANDILNTERRRKIMKRKTSEKMTVECSLTISEKLDCSESLAKLLRDRETKEDRKKAFNSQIKAEIDGFDAEINILTSKITTGTEFRDVDCAIEYDWKSKVRTWIRQDTFVEVKQDIIPESLLQEELDFEEKKEEDLTPETETETETT